jgi:predicted nucleotidyltransferase
MDLAALTTQLAALPNAEAVVLGGSRATGRHRLDSDWDLGIYYRGVFDAAHVRALGYEGTVVEPGEWGRLVNGGAWLDIDGERVDLLYRDLDFVSHWIDEAEVGRFEVDRVFGYIAGMPTYVLVGELALCKVLQGSLPRPPFPDALKRSAPPRWRSLRDFSLEVAKSRVETPDVTMFLGLCSTAVLAEAHARLAERGEWALNEKELADRAGLQDAHRALTSTDGSPEGLRTCWDRLNQVLVDVPRPDRQDDARDH